MQGTRARRKPADAEKFGYAGAPVPLWNALTFATLIFVLAVWVLNTIPRMAERGT